MNDSFVKTFSRDIVKYGYRGKSGLRVSLITSTPWVDLFSVFPLISACLDEK